jgi:diadenosine tetraphosphate (Ap4A) HIT family hydrolase
MVHMTNSCLVCRELSGQVQIPGGLLGHDDLVAAFHVPPRAEVDFLGHLLVIPRRHVADFAGLNAEEAAAIGVGISRWSAALKRMGAMRVYVATIGHGADHLHVHLLPRWPGTPEDVPWHSVDDWPGARSGDFASAEEMASLIRRNDQ